MLDPAPVRRSPLAHRRPLAAESGLVRMAERPFVGKFILRARPEDAVEPLRAVLGLGLPFDALTSSMAGGTAFLWLGPDEWMLATPPAEAAARSGTAREALSGLHHQLVDVSDYYTVIEIAGLRVRELLMKLTTLDVHPRAFRVGNVAGCILGRANVTLWQTADDEAAESAAPGSGPAFQLFIRWSMADYLWCLLAAAGRQWGLPDEIPVKGERLTID